MFLGGTLLKVSQPLAPCPEMRSPCTHPISAAAVDPAAWSSGHATLWSWYGWPLEFEGICAALRGHEVVAEVLKGINHGQQLEDLRRVGLLRSRELAALVRYGMVSG